MGRDGYRPIEGEQLLRGFRRRREGGRCLPEQVSPARDVMVVAVPLVRGEVGMSRSRHPPEFGIVCATSCRRFG